MFDPAKFQGALDSDGRFGNYGGDKRPVGDAAAAFESTGVPALAATPLRMVRHGGMAVQISGTETEIMVR